MRLRFSGVELYETNPVPDQDEQNLASSQADPRVDPRTEPILKVKLHHAYKVRNIGRVRPRLRFCGLC